MEFFFAYFSHGTTQADHAGQVLLVFQSGPEKKGLGTRERTLEGIKEPLWLEVVNHTVETCLSADPVKLGGFCFVYNSEALSVLI